VRARLQSDTRAEHRRDETAAGGGEGLIRALARAVAVHGARERAPTWCQDEFWSSGRCPNRSDRGSLSSTAPVRVMQQRFYTTKTHHGHSVRRRRPEWRIAAELLRRYGAVASGASRTSFDPASTRERARQKRRWDGGPLRRRLWASSVVPAMVYEYRH
jgi:hypothetical protein